MFPVVFCCFPCSHVFPPSPSIKSDVHGFHLAPFILPLYGPRLSQENEVNVAVNPNASTALCKHPMGHRDHRGSPFALKGVP